MKRTVSIIAAALMLVSLLAGSALADKVKLTFLWPTYTQSKVRYGEALVKQFEEANPDIDIDLQLVGNPYEKLKVLVAGGTPPDVVWLGAAWHQFAGLFEPLGGYVERDAAEIGVDEFIKPIWDSMIFKGTRYAVPTGYQTLAGFYNKDMFNEAGLAYPQDDWTVSEMIKDGKAMTKDTSGDGAMDQWGVSWLYGYIWSFIHYGGQIADPEWKTIRINNPVTAEALSLWDRLQTEYQVAPKNHGSLDMITGGQIGVFASGIWLQENLAQTNNFDYDLVDYPFLEVNGEKHRGTIIYPEELAILKTSNHKEEAWRFLKFAIGREHMKWAASEGHIVPLRIPIIQSNVFQRPDKRMQVWLTSTQYAMQLMPHPAYNELMAAFNQYWPKMSGPDAEMSVKNGLDQAAQAMQKVLDEYNARNK